MSLIFASLLKYWRLVFSQVSSYFYSYNLYNTCLSADHPGYSTDKHVLKVTNDLFLSLIKGNMCVLALHDFLSAFDTIDHFLLVHHLHIELGFTDAVIRRFSPCLVIGHTTFPY